VLCLAGPSGFSELTFEVPILGAGLCAANNNCREEPFLTASRFFHFFPVRAELEKSDALYVWLRDNPRLPRSANTRRTATIPTAASRADKPFIIKAGPNIAVRWIWIGLPPRLWAARNLLAGRFSSPSRMAALNWDAACVAAGVAKMDAVAFVNGRRGSCAPIQLMDREQAAKLAVDGLRNSNIAAPQWPVRRSTTACRSKEAN
jgi:hypothetical protein